MMVGYEERKQSAVILNNYAQNQNAAGAAAAQDQVAEETKGGAVRLQEIVAERRHSSGSFGAPESANNTEGRVV